MRHQVDGRKFGRNTSHRRAMFRNMANSLIEQEQIVTTLQKAKEVRRVVDRLITLGKTGEAHKRRLAFDRTRDQDVVNKLFNVLADRYKNRNGGYTRILKVSDVRRGDSAQMALIELVDHPPIDRKKKVKPEADAAQGTSSEEAAQQAIADPFSKFRKLFKGQKKGGGAQTGSGAPKASKGEKKKSTTVRKIGTSS